MQESEQEAKQKVRSSNLRTGLILASIALAFFAGIFVKRMWFN
ncbi:MAG TPA: cytochrome oxidase small assembly protein [Burkholderiaceae bacterium]